MVVFRFILKRKTEKIKEFQMTELNGKYVNEETHQRGKKFFMTLGYVFLALAIVGFAVGIPLVIKGFALANTSMSDPNWSELSSKGSSLIFGGFALCGVFGMMCGGVSLSMFIMAHRRELMAFGVSSALPVVGDGVKIVSKDIAPDVGEAVKQIAKPVVESISEPITDAISTAKGTKTASVCPNCKAEVKKTAKFCPDCGQVLKKEVVCKKCGAKLDKKTKFCPECGENIE
mgnify:FL=1